MRNRATAAAPTTTEAPASEAPEPTQPTKYDELVEVLVDGLFEIMMTEPHSGPMRTQR